VKWFAEPIQISRAFHAGEIDFRLDFVASVVQEYVQGHDVTLLAETNWSHGGDKIISKKDANFSLRKGSTIGIYRDSPALVYFLSVYLQSRKLKLSDFKVRVMPLEKIKEDFISGNLNFAVVFDPYTIDVVKGGNGKVRGNSAQFPGCMPEGIYARKETLATIPKQDLVALMGASAKAANWMRNKDNWARLRHLLNEQVLPDKEPFSDKELRAMLRFVKIHHSKILVNRNKPGGGLTKYLQDMKKFLGRNKQLGRGFEVEELLDSSALLAALEGL